MKIKKGNGEMKDIVEGKGLREDAMRIIGDECVSGKVFVMDCQAAASVI